MNLQPSWRKLSNTISSLFLFSLLTACGSSDNAFLSNENATSALRLGTGTGTSFQESVIGISTNNGTTTVSVNLVDETGNIAATSANYVFTSSCVSDGQGLFDNDSVSSTNGSASAVYTDQSCSSDNVFSVTATTDALETYTATATTAPPAESTRLGTGSGSSFVDKQINIANTNLGAIDSTALSVSIVDADGNLDTASSATIVFTSTCADNTQASFAAVTLTNGVASTTYTTAGCEGTDAISATTTVNQVTATATGNVSVAAVELGDKSGVTFIANNILLEKTNLDSIDTSKITVYLSDTLGNLITSANDVTFSSPCITNGTASISPSGAISTGTTGIASTTYTTAGCSGTDVITASATFNGKSLTATSTFSIASFRLGGTNGSFNNGALKLSATQIAAAGDVNVTANLVGFAGTAFTNNATVIFSSACVANTDASLTNVTVNTSNGTATTTYSAGTCSGTDTITATATTDGVTLTASADIQIMPNRIGATSTGSFVEDTIDFGLSSISVDGNTSVTVRLLDFNDQAVTSPHTVTFSSQCAFSNDAKFSDNNGDTNTDSIINGIAVLTYTATGCVGDDIITITTQSGNDTLTATGTLSIAAAGLGSIQLASISNSLISLKGLGTLSQPESTTVSFTVRNDQGEPLAGEIVDFSLDTNAGGLKLATSSDISNSSGLVSVVAQSGSVPTTFSVNAEVTSNTDVASQSTSISISTGPATQNSFSLVADILNPRGYDFFGTKVKVTVFSADRYGNAIQDGTSISFKAEGGFIDSQCTTSSGECSVTWKSAAPVPSDGRATIFAHFTGEENYTLANANGVFDIADSFNFGAGSEAITADDDLPEAFQDDNENGIRDSDEFYVDFNNNNSYTPDDNAYSGIGCIHPTLCSSNETITIFKNLTLVMAEDSAKFEDDEAGAGLSDLTIANDASNTVVYTINGQNTGQVLPVSTKVVFALAGDSGCSFSGPSSFTVANTNLETAGISDYEITYKCDGANPGSGTMTVSVTIPGVTIQTRTIDIAQQ